MEGRTAISAYLSQDVNGRSRISNAGIHDLKIDSTSSLGGPSIVQSLFDSSKQVIQSCFTFRTKPRHCNLNDIRGIGRGFFRLMQDSDEQWKAFTLFLNLEDLEGFEEPKERPQADYDDEMRTWAEVREADAAAIDADPTVLISVCLNVFRKYLADHLKSIVVVSIVGGGHAGLSNAARLGRMGVKALVVEKTARVGDVWRNR